MGLAPHPAAPDAGWQAAGRGGCPLALMGLAPHPAAPDAGWQAAGRGKVLGVSSHYDYEWDFRNRTIRYDSHLSTMFHSVCLWLPIPMITILESVSPGILIFIL